MIHEVESEVKLLNHPSTSLQDPQQSEFTFKQQRCYYIQLYKLHIYKKERWTKQYAWNAKLTASIYN